MKANQLEQPAMKSAVFFRLLLLGVILAGIALSWASQPVLNGYYEAMYGAKPGARLIQHLRS